ncbi:hypothetical protein EYC08_17960 [Tabrizicola sp. WMC-M-20]|nr:hypothetical protein EYC08_17960 [Tabrizicola sp. WMC-M-20]
MLRSLIAVLWSVVLAGLLLSAAFAQQTTAYDLRSASFTLPADWTITYSSRDQEYDFVSPDGRFELWARWWFPDEPLLGFDDIVHHEKRNLAGQDALFRHVESSGQRTLSLAFLKADAEGEIFLWQLLSSDASLAEHRAMFDTLLTGLTLDGQTMQTATPPTPASNVFPVTAAMPAEAYRDPEGAFALPLPTGWTVQTTASAGLRQAVLVPPSRDALLLAVAARPDRGLTAAEILGEYIGVLYRDSLVVKSIETEDYPDIAGTTVHAIETLARVYAINGVAMPYTRGRVWIYRSNDEADGRAPFVIVSIRPETAADQLTVELQRVATGFTFDAPHAPAVPDDPTQVAAATVELPALNPAGELPITSALEGLLFDGKTFGGLLPIAFKSAPFDDNARFTGNEINLGVPAGMGGAKLGLATPLAVIGMPLRDSTKVQRISAVIDADQSTGITFVFLPPENAAQDPDAGHDLKVRLFTTGDGTGTIETTTSDPKQNHTARFPWPKGEAVVHLLLQPDQVLDVRDGNGTQLTAWAMDADFGGRRWALQTYVEAGQRNQAAALVLKRLSFDTLPLEPRPDFDAIATDPQSVVIFDGYAFDRIWQPVSRGNAEIARYLRLSDGALRVGWSAEDKGSWTGMATPDAVLWLDRFTGTAEARVDLALDGAASKDFEIALQSAYSLPGNLSGNLSYVLRFTQQADGTYSALSALRSQEKNGLVSTGLPALPDHVTLVLTPEGVRVEGAGMPVGILPFGQIADGAGFRIAIHARAAPTGDGALVVRGVRLSRSPDTNRAVIAPAAGVPPLPHRVFFSGHPDQTWETRSNGKATFADLATQHADGLTLRRSEPVMDWSRIALVGSALMVDLDYRVNTTPYEVVVKLDPATGLGARIFLHRNSADPENSAESVVTLRELTTGPNRGGLEVQLHTGHFSYDYWRRVLPAEQWRDRWDGTLRLRFGPKSIAVALGDDLLMQGPRLSTELMMAITPGGAGKFDGGHVKLQSVTGGWISPAGMTARERLSLLDVKDFDPTEFLNLLNAE